VLNWISRICALLYKLRGYEPIESEKRDRLEELAGDYSPHEIWIGGRGSKTLFGNVVLDKRECESYEQSEIEAIFLHEVGHIRDKLSYKVVAPFAFTIILAIIFVVTRSVATLFMFLVAFLFFLLFLYKRYPKYEYSADEYATNEGYGEELISVLQDKQSMTGELNIIGKAGMFFYPSFESRIRRVRQTMER
jgi:hypothetical protein